MSKELLTIVSDSMYTLLNPVLVQRNLPFMYRDKMILTNAEESSCNQCDLYRPHMVGVEKCGILCIRVKLGTASSRSFKIIE